MTRLRRTLMFKAIIAATIITSTLFATGCTSTPSSTQQAQNLSLLQNKNWTLTHIGATEYKADPSSRNAPSIQFGSDLRVSGSDGCNRIMGQYALKGQHITIGQLASTKMLCPSSMQIATQYTEALSKVQGFQVYDKTLKLVDQYGNRVLQFTTP